MTMHTILVYHTISSPVKALPSNIDVAPALFESHLRWLSRRHNRINTLETLLSVPENKRQLAITFDDGYKDNLTVALPLLEKYEMPATIFVAAGFIGKDGFLTTADLKILSRHPLITIGSHGLTHGHFPQMSEAEARFELTESKQILENAVNRTVDLLAWSYGDCNDELERISAECGYRAAWSVWNGNNTPHSRWRVPLGRRDNLPRFVAKISPLYFPVKRRLKPPIVGARNADFGLRGGNLEFQS
jgi:peptidoglycan/xylan/chitin deacetylase (PgdA/CDA1 family)